VPVFAFVGADKPVGESKRVSNNRVCTACLGCVVLARLALRCLPVYPTLMSLRGDRYPVVLAEALGLGVGLGSGPENSLLLRTPDQSADDLTSLLLAEAQKKGGEASAAYPSALANVLDLSDRGGVAAPVQAVYPAALAHILDLSASGPTQEAPQAYPQALAQLQLDPAEAVAARAEQRDTGASQQEQDKLNLFEKFDRIAQEFARKFGV
jgi:hypothetical protein